MAALDLKKRDAVFVVTMSDEEDAHTFATDVLKDRHRIPDEIERSTENAAVVLTSGHPKTRCTGINVA
jgi:enoyl-CoA hydratase/carnithine racemase